MDEAPPGADGGIDITAGRGLLGLESPKVIVQVKTGQIGSEVVAQLNGLVSTHGADYGLLATWTGLSKPARDAVKHQRFRVKCGTPRTSSMLSNATTSVCRGHPRSGPSSGSGCSATRADHPIWMSRSWPITISVIGVITGVVGLDGLSQDSPRGDQRFRLGVCKHVVELEGTSSSRKKVCTSSAQWRGLVST